MTPLQAVNSLETSCYWLRPTLTTTLLVEECGKPTTVHKSNPANTNSLRRRRLAPPSNCFLHNHTTPPITTTTTTTKTIRTILFL